MSIKQEYFRDLNYKMRLTPSDLARAIYVLERQKIMTGVFIEEENTLFNQLKRKIMEKKEILSTQDFSQLSLIENEERIILLMLSNYYQKDKEIYNIINYCVENNIEIKAKDQELINQICTNRNTLITRENLSLLNFLLENHVITTNQIAIQLSTEESAQNATTEPKKSLIKELQKLLIEKEKESLQKVVNNANLIEKNLLKL